MTTVETQIEELEKMRTRWLLVNLIGFVLWDGFRIIDSYLIEGGIATPFQIINLFGWLTWTLGLVQLTRLGFKAKKVRQASQILNDELVEIYRLKSWRLALFVVLLTQMVIIALSILSFDVSGILSAEISIFTAVTAALSAFIYYEMSTND
jgi:hypothetical protein